MIPDRPLRLAVRLPWADGATTNPRSGDVTRPSVLQVVRGGKEVAPAIVVLASVYFIAAKLGLTLATVHPSATGVWPPTGIAIAALLLVGERAWAGVFIGAFFANVTTDGSTLSSLGIAGGNTLEALVAARLVRRFARGVRAFERPQDFFKFIVLAVIASTALSATIGVSSLSLTGYADVSDFGAIWLTWWLGDAAGALVVAPALVPWGVSRQLSWNRSRPLDAARPVLALN